MAWFDATTPAGNMQAAKPSFCADHWAGESAICIAEFEIVPSHSEADCSTSQRTVARQRYKQRTERIWFSPSLYPPGYMTVTAYGIRYPPRSSVRRGHAGLRPCQSDWYPGYRSGVGDALLSFHRHHQNAGAGYPSARVHRPCETAGYRYHCRSDHAGYTAFHHHQMKYGGDRLSHPGQRPSAGHADRNPSVLHAGAGHDHRNTCGPCASAGRDHQNTCDPCENAARGDRNPNVLCAGDDRDYHNAHVLCVNAGRYVWNDRTCYRNRGDSCVTYP